MAKRGHDIDAEIDAIFQLSLADFTAGRNDLAKRLKNEGRADDAERVKALVKPPAPAWAVNQLYWQDSKTIDRLLTLGERVRQAQAGRLKNVDLRALLDEKKQLTAALQKKASAILEDAGHAASPDALRRVSMTLEALAASGGVEDAPRPGRLTADLDPPGFDTLAALMPPPTAPRRRSDEAVRTAEKALIDAQRDAERADATLARANARADELGALYEKAKADVRAAAAEAKQAAQAVADAERALAKEKKTLGR